MSSLLNYLQSTGLKFKAREAVGCQRVELQVKAKTGAKKEKILVGEQGILEVFVGARPVKGAANEAIVKFVAKSFGVPPSAVSLVKGEKSRIKCFLVEFSYLIKGQTHYIEKLKRALEK